MVDHDDDAVRRDCHDDFEGVPESNELWAYTAVQLFEVDTAYPHLSRKGTTGRTLE